MTNSMEDTITTSSADTKMMKIHVHGRDGRFMATFLLKDSNESTVDDLKEAFCKKFHFYPERQKLTTRGPRGPVLKDGTSLKLANGVSDGSTIYFKDLGVQISWRLVFVLEYAGPIFILPIFWFGHSLIYNAATVERCLAQRLAFALFELHFIKREFETLFIHRFSNATMPIKRIPINCAHYWLLCGVAIGYYLCHPNYRAAISNPWVSFSLSIAMLLCEVMNFNCHLVLRNLRSRGSKERGIPHGFGFDLISCANYFWETLAWLSFSALVGCFTSWIFTVIAFAQMTEWALKKHQRYHREFKDYPRRRKAIVPFIL